MKILCVCAEGNNRSVTLAHQLKYKGHDCISVGLNTNGIETIKMLCAWADKIIVTENVQCMPAGFADKIVLFDIGPDVYPRPFNKQLLRKVRSLIEHHNY